MARQKCTFKWQGLKCTFKWQGKSVRLARQKWFQWQDKSERVNGKTKVYV